MTLSRWQRQESKGTPDINTDVLIVGGGFVGLSVGFWLTEFKPETKVTIIDRSQSGDGASGKNAGFITLGSANFYKSLAKKWGTAKALEIHNYALESIDSLFEKILEGSLKSEITSSMTLFKTEDLWESWNDKSFVTSDFGLKLIESTQLPSSLRSKFHCGLEGGREFKINPIELLKNLKTRLIERNVNILENISAFDIHPDGVRTEVNNIKAKHVVLAMNGYLGEFHSAFKEFIRPKRAQMLAVEVNSPLALKHLYYDPYERIYWRQVQNNILIIGGKRLMDEAGEIGTFDKVSPVIQNGLEDYIKNHLDIEYRALNRWSGVMGFTKNELPYIQKVESPTATYVIGGFSGHGMGFGFKSAMEMAQIVLGNKKESFFSQFEKVDFNL